MQGAQISRKGWLEILALGPEPGAQGGPGCPCDWLLPRPGHWRPRAAGGKGVQPSSPLPPQSLASPGNCACPPDAQYRTFQTLRPQCPGRVVLPECPHLLPSSADLTESSSFFQAQLQPPSFLGKALVLWPSPLNCLRSVQWVSWLTGLVNSPECLWEQGLWLLWVQDSLRVS